VAPSCDYFCSGNTTIYFVFFTLFHKWHNLRRKCIEDKTYFVFSTIFVEHISHPAKNSKRYQKYTQVFMYSPRYYSQSLIKLDFSSHILEKSSNIKLYGNASIRNRVVPCGRTDGRDETNSRFSQCYESPKN
jgi:hypothetical protein